MPVHRPNINCSPLRMALLAFALFGSLSPTSAQEMERVDRDCPNWSEPASKGRVASCLKLISSGRLEGAWKGTSYGRIGSSYMLQSMSTKSLPVDASAQHVPRTGHGCATDSERSS